MKNTGRIFSLVVMAAALAAVRGTFAASASEILIDLRMTHSDYLIGERIRAVVDVKNMSPNPVSVGYPDSQDRLFVEVYRAHDMYQLDRKDASKPFVAPFQVKMNEGLKLEVFLGSHYGLSEPRRYLARPVLVHNGMRYEGAYRAFDMVPGLEISKARQIFANVNGLNREFTLLKWSRGGREHLFMAAQDDGISDRKWRTFDLGEMMRITSPTISILAGGEVIVIHRFGADQFLRSVFWSLPGAIEFRGHEVVQDPETAGQNRVQEMHKGRGSVKPKDHPWWKFW